MIRRLALVSLTLAALTACRGDPVVPRGGPDSTHVLSPAALDSAERATHAPGDTLFASVVVGDGVSCALTRGGRAFCWGDDRLAQLGVAQGPHGCPYAQYVDSVIGQFPACSPAPVAVDTGRKFVALATGGVAGRVCGLTVVGRIWCWGGDRVFHSVWLIPSGDVRYASLGDTADCAIRTTGSIDCFGWKLSTPQFLPPSGGPVWSPFDGAQRYTAIASPCATTADGEMRCWGDVDTTTFATKGVSHDICTGGGSPGRPAYQYNCHYPPVRLALTAAWKRPVTAPYPCCGITPDGRLQMWANDNAFTREWTADAFVGGVRPSAANPIGTVAVPEPVQRAWTGYELQCAWGVSGRLWCFGSDYLGVYGNGAVAEGHTAPSLVAGGRTFVSVDVTSDHACGVTADGAVLCWGSDANGQLGVGGTVASGTCANGTENCVAEPTRIASVAGKRSSG